MTLEVGDILVYKYYSSTSLKKVTRVTPKRAYVGDHELKREVDNPRYIKIIGASQWHSACYYVPAPEEIELRRQEARHKQLVEYIKALNPHSLTIDQLTRIKAIAEEGREG